MPDPTGWMPGIEHIPSQEWGYEDIVEDGMYPQAVMSHVMQGYIQTMIDWARNSNGGKSVQFLVGRDGRKIQTVSIWNPSWGAGDVNTPAWRKYVGGNPNKVLVQIECEGFSVDPVVYPYDYLYDATHPWPEPMIQSVLEIHQFVFQRCAGWMLPTDDTVITHSMTNSKSRANDPGNLWLTTVRPRLLASLQASISGPLLALPGTGLPTPGPPTPNVDVRIIESRDKLTQVIEGR